MSGSMMERLVEATKQELVRALGELAAKVGAAESSILLPKDDAELVFFASTNPALMRAETPHVPINSSFSGIAYRTGQLFAVADASTQTPHFKAVDEHLRYATHEFAAIPLAHRQVLGVLSLVNRTAPARDGMRGFGVAELQQAQAFATDTARTLEQLPGLAGIEPQDEITQLLGSEFVADLRLLSKAELRVAHALTNALIQNRAG
jgi:GAF domain